MTAQACRTGACLAVLLLAQHLAPPSAEAGRLQDYLDSIDLNEYSMAVSLYTSQSQYSGVDDFAILYPAPSTFDHASVSTDAFFVRDGYAGLRKVWDNGWTAGAVGVVQTLGFGSDDSEALAGMSRRGWTVQGGGTIGRKLGPLHFDLFATTDLLGVNNGYELDFKVAWPFQRPRLQVVPQIDVLYQSADVVNYYFGVSAAEAGPGRPQYTPGAAVSITPGVDVRVRFLPKWYLSFAANVDLVADEIKASPIVDRSTAWRFHLAVAYDGHVFLPTDDTASDDAHTHLSMSVGAFWISSASKLNLASDGPAATLDLEDETGLESSGTTFPLDIEWQFGRFHRVDLRYFELVRDGAAQIAAPLTIGNTTFGADETVTTSLNTKILRVGYGFSFFRDPQKDLSIFGGAHVTDIEFRIEGESAPVVAKTTAALPVIGARLRVSPAGKFSLFANAEFFNLDFDQYSGELLDLSVSGAYRIAQRLFAGGGYRVYRQNIRSGDESLQGEYSIDYRGPYAFVAMRF